MAELIYGELPYGVWDLSRVQQIRLAMCLSNKQSYWLLGTHLQRIGKKPE